LRKPYQNEVEHGKLKLLEKQKLDNWIKLRFYPHSSRNVAHDYSQHEEVGSSTPQVATENIWHYME